VTETIDIAIIGGGPAGMTAALYGARARANTVVFELGLPGGQVTKTELVENYPAFPDGVPGADLGEYMHRQAERFGAEFRTFSPVEAIRREGDVFVMVADDTETVAKTVILAMGAVPRKLGIPGENEFTGRGVSWCATCDGPLFRGKVVAVVGGGDAAAQEAEFLTKFAGYVYLIHRRDELRATECLQEKCVMNPLIEYHLSRVPTEIVGREGKVHAIRLTSTKGEPEELLEVGGVFIFVGVDPTSELARGLADLNDAGFVKVDGEGRTSVPGLYAAGDVTDHALKQVITAAGQGAAAAFDALRYIEAKVPSG